MSQAVMTMGARFLLFTFLNCSKGSNFMKFNIIHPAIFLLLAPFGVGKRQKQIIFITNEFDTLFVL